MNICNLPYDLETVADEDKQAVIIRRYTGRANTVRNKIILHRNMINMLLCGTKTIVHAEATTIVNAGEFALISCGNCLTSEVLPGDDVFSSIILYFSNEALTDFFIKYAGFLPGVEAKNKHPFLTYRQDDFIRNYIQSLQHLLQTPELFTDSLRHVKLEELLLYLLHHDAAKLRSLQIVAKDDEDLLLRKAVETNIGNPVTVDDLAFLCNISTSTFKRKFSRIYGTSPQKWILQQRMQMAASLLKHASETPATVYEKVGYENHSSFTQSFKQQFGVTPSEYREQHLTV